MDNPNVNGWTILAGLLVTATIYKVIKDSRTPLPPGPRGIPLLGNIFNTSPSRQLWVQFKEISQYYGVSSFLSPVSLLIATDTGRNERQSGHNEL